MIFIMHMLSCFNFQLFSYMVTVIVAFNYEPGTYEEKL